MKLGGRIGTLGPSQSTSVAEVDDGLVFFGSGFLAATWTTLLASRRFARCSEAFNRTSTTTMIPRRTTLEKDMSVERWKSK